MNEYTPFFPGSPRDNMLLEANQQLVLALLRGQGEDAPRGGDATGRRFAERDALTGLPGRMTLLARFESAAAAASREGKRLGILFLDLDGFKQLNDGLSHRAGDDALRHAAHCLDAAVRTSDTVSRYGGDEFVVLLADLAHRADAARVAEKMLVSLMVPEWIGGHPVSMSASIGISIYPDDGRALDELVHHADAAMYRGKRQGSGYYVFHGDPGAPGRRFPLPDTAPGVIYPHAVSASGERLRQIQMQEANEHLLLAALSAQEMQSTAERALGEQAAVLAKVAHELRNPLTPISVAASMIERADAHELPQLRALIERQVVHVAHLVDDLLDVSRARLGKLRLEWGVVDVARVLAEVVEACRPAVDARRQRLVVQLPDEPLRVRGDPVRLAQVLSNLIDNASKYTPEEGIVTVEAYGAEADAVIRVSDTGIGIRPGALATVFQPFVQEPHATRFNGAGLGIGLTVVRDLVNAHAGTVQAFSAGEGQGSQFVLTLPLHAPAGELAARPGGHVLDADPILPVTDNPPDPHRTHQ